MFRAPLPGRIPDRLAAHMLPFGQVPVVPALRRLEIRLGGVEKVLNEWRCQIFVPNACDLTAPRH